MAARKLASAQGAQVIDLPVLNVKIMTIGIKGMSPLIVNNWSEKAREEMRNKQMGAARMKKEPKEPKKIFEASKYKSGGSKSWDGVPVGGMKKCILSAAKDASLFKTDLRRAFFIQSDGIDQVSGLEIVRVDYKKCRMREDMCRVGTMTKTADIRYRAEYTDWSIKLRIEYNANTITPGQIANLLRLAGFSVGLCEWRPEKDGNFGRFTIDDKGVTSA